MASIQRPLNGVNLGGWLVLEPWLTPSLFKDIDAQDEYGYCQRATPMQRQALKQFRDTFITEQDFIWLAQHGVEAVRLPVGYWLFGKQGSFLKTYQYVDMVFEWATKYGLRVLVDLHGAPGSQNGQMHSGQRGAAGWHANEQNIEATLYVLQRIAQRYGRQPALLGISFLNEPLLGFTTSKLDNFYKRAQAVVASHCRPDVWLVFSDAFKPRRWRHLQPGLHMDHHQYQIYSPLDKLLPGWLQLLRTQYFLPGRLRRLARGHPLVIGEWSLVLPRSKGSRRYGQLQQRAFAPAAAAFYWNYKTEAGGLWSFRDCVTRGLLSVD